ncbi:M20/M25/M40 family metallo-hydrolase [Rubrivirga sp.]|uniref:M20/M25/M40 family metallo-hydrolase n=1 Tax=Rubrivirga sp. TaxID=1885344 RepID=UPI003B52292C
MRLALLALLVAAGTAHAQPDPSERYAEATARIVEAALADSAAFDRVALLADTFGPRFTGTPALEAAIDQILAEMRADGLENVRGQPVTVPVWVRGAESATLVTPSGDIDLPMLGLGGSVGTPGIEAEVLVVGSFDELTARVGEARGRIVLFDVPFTSYGETVPYRVGGASAAAEAGAVASLVRSVGPTGLSTPHTGVMRYADGDRQIPHAALTAEASGILRRIQDRGERPVVRLAMSAETRADGLSRNVIGELRGRERPDEVVILGGHLDSWDVGQGVHDDLAGCVVTWEAVALLNRLGLRPRRTVRVALWTNEENGLRGAETFRDSLGADVSHVQLALESDSGVFTPVGFGYGGSEAGRQMLAARVEPLIRDLLMADSEVGPAGITLGGGGADIGPLMRDGVPGLSLRTDNGDYFVYHHTPADTVDKLDPADVQRAVAATAVLIWVAAEMPERLPHGE